MTDEKAGVGHVLFGYMYRDAGNWKNGRHVTFTNKTGMPVDEIDRRLKAAFQDGEHFIARQIRVPDSFFPGTGEDDHCWHEYNGVEEHPMDVHADLEGRDIRQFVEEVENAAKKGWEEYTREEVEAPYVPGVVHYYDATQYGTLLNVTPTLHMWHITYDNRQNEYIYIGEYQNAVKAAEGLKHTVDPPLTTRARVREITGYKTRTPDKRIRGDVLLVLRDVIFTPEEKP